jgi:hypothetical protein
MRDIYASASEVVVFLGDGRGHRITGLSRQPRAPERIVFHNDESDDQHVMAFVTRWSETSSRQRVEPLDIFCFIRMLSHCGSSQFSNLKQNLMMQLELILESLRMMLMSQWWVRMWVFQEVIVSSKVTLQYGGVECPWGMFSAAAVQYQNQRAAFHEADSKIMDHFSKLVLDIEERRQAWLERSDEGEIGEVGELLALLRATSARQASDDRDKVFALLGLVRNQSWIVPDYTLSTREVYTNVVRHTVKATGTLDIFCGDLGRKNRRDLPSWVPDWSATVDDQEIRRANPSIIDMYDSCRGSKVVYLAGQ